jgi:hypothetical protein
MFKNKLFVAVSLLAVSSLSYAYPRHDPNVYDKGNLWSITFHNDDSVNHDRWATQRICFLPYTFPAAGETHIKGKWYSTTYPNWNGYWQQEGDEVKMLGNYANGAGNDVMSFDVVTGKYNTLVTTPANTVIDTVGAGHWTEWRDTGVNSSFHVFGNTLMQRVGKCQVPKTQTALDLTLLARQIKPRTLLKGGIAEFPLQQDQVPLEGVNKLEELLPITQPLLQ